MGLSVVFVLMSPRRLNRVRQTSICFASGPEKWAVNLNHALLIGHHGLVERTIAAESSTGAEGRRGGRTRTRKKKSRSRGQGGLAGGVEGRAVHSLVLFSLPSLRCAPLAMDRTHNTDLPSPADHVFRLVLEGSLVNRTSWLCVAPTRNPDMAARHVSDDESRYAFSPLERQHNNDCYSQVVCS